MRRAAGERRLAEDKGKGREAHPDKQRKTGSHLSLDARRAVFKRTKRTCSSKKGSNAETFRAYRDLQNEDSGIIIVVSKQILGGYKTVSSRQDSIQCANKEAGEKQTPNCQESPTRHVCPRAAFTRKIYGKLTVNSLSQVTEFRSSMRLKWLLSVNRPVGHMR
ncbi:hypothetical protein Bbelb_374780 [Branchiostoma belcheri]|nr:hypothetical protein Bbelb_374780 [Branchiostoma belcheri]